MEKGKSEGGKIEEGKTEGGKMEGGKTEEGKEERQKKERKNRCKNVNGYLFPMPISVEGVVRGLRWGIGPKGAKPLSSHHIWTLIPSVG
jgi:hypothetical protein